MYYRLTYISSSDKARLGDCMLNGSKALNIGQGTVCDLQLPESEMYEPELYASILPQQTQDGQLSPSGGWYVTRRSDSRRVLVNGEEVGIAQSLNSGDTLSFSDGEQVEELKFEVFDDGDYDVSSGFVYKKHQSQRRYFLVTVALTVLAIGIAAYALLAPREQDLRHLDLDTFCQSTYHVVVDSVYLECDMVVDGVHTLTVTEAIELEEAAEGTAFLTSDSLFVTARHCIEPWINDEEWDGVPDRNKMSPEVRLATTAETENRLAGYQKYRLRAHCVISKGLERYDYYSTDFSMNKSRDMVMRLGTGEKVFYWRTIFPIAHRRDMELGDFAYVKAAALAADAVKSEITLADWDDLVTFANGGHQDIAVIGYPLNDNDAEMVSVVYGNLMAFEYHDSLQAPVGCLQLSAPINPGNSGGPVFAKIGDALKVIGIVSKADGRASQGLFWAVPVTEVVTMHAHGDYVEEDSVTYRR